MVFIVWVRKLTGSHTSRSVCSERSEERLNSSCLTLRRSSCCVPSQRYRSPFKNSPAMWNLQAVSLLEQDSQIILSSFETLNSRFLVLAVYSSLLGPLLGQGTYKNPYIAASNIRPMKSSWCGLLFHCSWFIVVFERRISIGILNCSRTGYAILG